jgi:cytochrome oxidase Cu insertion factor (SCO1/SenC/PrrC family)
MSLKYAIGPFVVAVAMLASMATAYAENWHTDFDGPFELVNGAGETVTEKDLLGHKSLIYFGYTQCLMQCPPTWITLDQVVSRLKAEGTDVRAYFVSIDPDRDTVEVLENWQKNWPNITGLTGTREQIHDVAEVFHVFFARKPMHAMSFAMKDMMRVKNKYGSDERIDWDRETPHDYYMMDHTFTTFLLDENGKYVTHFELEEDADTIVDYIRKPM